MDSYKERFIQYMHLQPPNEIFALMIKMIEGLKQELLSPSCLYHFSQPHVCLSLSMEHQLVG